MSLAGFDLEEDYYDYGLENIHAVEFECYNDQDCPSGFKCVDHLCEGTQTSPDFDPVNVEDIDELGSSSGTVGGGSLFHGPYSGEGGGGSLSYYADPIYDDSQETIPVNKEGSCQGDGDCPYCYACEAGYCVKQEDCEPIGNYTGEYPSDDVYIPSKEDVFECRNHSDCQSGFYCVDENCVSTSEVSALITGIVDGKTCPFCRSMIGRIGSLDSISLPPYHKHCRCTVEYLI